MHSWSAMEDDYRDSDDRPAPFVWLKVLGVTTVIAVVLAMIWSLAETPKDRNLATYPNSRERATQPPRLPAPTTSQDERQSSPVATSGSETAAAANAYELTAPAVIHELDTITGELDGTALVGRKVDLRVAVLREHTPVSFWIGPADNPILVVMQRDVRSVEDRQTSSPPSHGISPVHRGQEALITGTIQPVPRAEERASWGLTASQQRDLEARRIYLRAESVRSAGHGE